MSAHACETKDCRFVEITSVAYIQESEMYSTHTKVKLLKKIKARQNGKQQRSSV